MFVVTYEDMLEDSLQAIPLDAAKGVIVDEGMDRLADKARKAGEDYAFDKAFDDIIDPNGMSPEYNARTYKHQKALFDDAIDKTMDFGKRATGVASVLHDSAEYASKVSNALAAEDLVSNNVDAIASKSYNHYLRDEVGTGVHDHFEVDRKLFDGPHDDLYNLALHHTSRMMEPDMRDGYFQRMKDLASQHYGDSLVNAPDIVQDMKNISDNNIGVEDHRMLSELEARAQDNGAFNPHGAGHLYYDANGSPTPGPEEMAHWAREEHLAGLSPIDRAVETGAIKGGYASLRPQDIPVQVEHDLPDALAQATPGEAFHRHMSDPRTMDSIRCMSDELDAQGVETVDVLVDADMTASGRVIQTYGALGDAAQEHDCYSFPSAERAVHKDFEAAEPQRYHDEIIAPNYDGHLVYPDNDAGIDTGL